MGFKVGMNSRVYLGEWLKEELGMCGCEYLKQLRGEWIDEKSDEK